MASNNKIINNKTRKEYWLPEELWREVLGFVGVLTVLPNNNNRKVRWTLFKHLQYKDMERSGLGGRFQAYNLKMPLRFNSDGSDKVICGKKETSIKEYKFNIRKQHLIGAYNKKHKIIMRPKFWYDLSDTLIKRLGPAVCAEVGDVWKDTLPVPLRTTWLPATTPFDDELFVSRWGPLDRVRNPSGKTWSEEEQAAGLLFNNADIEYKITNKLKSRIKYVVNKITLNRSRPPSMVSWSLWESNGGWGKSYIISTAAGEPHNTHSWEVRLGKKGVGPRTYKTLKTGPEVTRMMCLLNQTRRSVSPNWVGGETAMANRVSAKYQTDRDELLTTLFIWALTAAEEAGVEPDADGDVVFEGDLLYYVMGDPTHEWTLEMPLFKKRCKMLNNSII